MCTCTYNNGKCILIAMAYSHMSHIDQHYYSLVDGDEMMCKSISLLFTLTCVGVAQFHQQ